MAAGCTYTIEGKTYSEIEFKEYLLKGGLNSFINKGEVVLPLEVSNLFSFQSKTNKNENSKKRNGEESGKERSEKSRSQESGESSQKSNVNEEGGVPPGAPSTSEGEVISIAHAELNKLAEELGFPEYEVSPETIEQWDKQAEERLVKEGITPVINKMKDGEMPSKIEQRMVLMYIADLKNRANKNPTDEILLELKDTIELSNVIGGGEVGKSLAARKGFRPVDDSLAGAFVQEMMELGVGKLTMQQKFNIEKEWEAEQKAKKEFKEYLEKKEAEQSQKNAAAVIEEMRKNKRQQKSQELSKQRKEIIDDILLKFRKKDESASFLGAAKLAEITPDVLKLAKNIVASGVVKLQDVVDQIHDLLKTDIPELEKSEIQSIIAGKYTPKKKTESELRERWRDLTDEAKLVDQLEALERGEEPKTESKRIQRNKQIEDLRKQIKEHDLTKLAEDKKRIKAQISRIEEQLRTGDFTNKKSEVKLDDEGRKLKNKLLELRKQKEIRKEKERYNLRSKKQKALDRIVDVMNVPRSLMASVDFSAPLNQAAFAVSAYPGIAKEAAVQMFKAAKSQSVFDEWFYELKDSPRYELMKDAGLKISDPHSAFLTAREEAFMSGYADKISDQVFGRFGFNPIKGSERAYTQFLNKMRVDLFNKFAQIFEDDGKTYANNKKLYDKTAKFINNITGAGNMGKLDEFAPVLSSLFFSPRLIASRINLLNPFYAASLPKELLKDYAKVWGGYIASRAAIIGAFALYGKMQGDDDDDKITVETDPRSSDFWKIKQGNTRWDFSGGVQPYVRMGAQLITGQRKASTTGAIQELDGEKPGASRKEVGVDFVRGKLAPIPSLLWNIIEGENVVGEKTTVGGVLLNNLVPLSIQGLIEGWKEHGGNALWKVGIPSVFGVGTNTYSPRQKEIKETITYRKNGESYKVNLTDKQYEDYERTARRYITEDLNKVEKMEGFDTFSDTEKANIKRNVENAAVSKAEKEIIKKYKNEFVLEEPDEKKKREKEFIEKAKKNLK